MKHVMDEMNKLQRLEFWKEQIMEGIKDDKELMKKVSNSTLHALTRQNILKQCKSRIEEYKNELRLITKLKKKHYEKNT